MSIIDEKMDTVEGRNKDADGEDCQYIFPQRLMSVLSDDANSDAICWLPHGRAFIIRERNLFAEKVMPKFFPRKSKYSSFTRKLNRWNFIRVASGPELGAYYHEFFLREQPHLAAQMFCKNARTKIAMATSEPEPASLQKLMQFQEMSPLSVKGQSSKFSTLDPTHFLVPFDTKKVDSAMQMILKQQLGLCNRNPLHFQQQHQQRVNQLKIHRQHQQQKSMIDLLLGSGGANAGTTLSPGAWLQQEILAQQQQRMLQMQQLLTLNLQQKNRKVSEKKSLRASAA